MIPPADDLGRFTADLRTWLRQQGEAGVEWFLDPGAPGPPSEVESPDAVEPVVAPPRAAASRTAPPAAPAPPPSVTIEKDAAFAAASAAFVQDITARIAGRREGVKQSDIFSAPEPVPERLTRAQKGAALAELAAEVAPCARCKLAATRTQTVFGVGDPGAGLVFVGEAPGRDEDLKGEPFVGRAGQLLNDILKAIALRRDEVYICNILKCRPPENRDPEADEVEACEPYLKRQLEIIDPVVVCCLGRHAAHTLLRTNANLNALRERAHFYGEIPVVVTYHPAALLRNPHWKRPTWDDVRKLRALYDALREAKRT